MPRQAVLLDTGVNSRGDRNKRPRRDSGGQKNGERYTQQQLHNPVLRHIESHQAGNRATIARILLKKRKKKRNLGNRQYIKDSDMSGSIENSPRRKPQTTTFWR